MRSKEELLNRVKELPSTHDEAWLDPNFDNPWPEVTAYCINRLDKLDFNVDDAEEIAIEFLIGDNTAEKQDYMKLRYNLTDAQALKVFEALNEFSEFCGH
jgi:hypothetical protein